MSIKIALVHDDLVQWGGAERVLLAMSEVFPDAPIYTSVFDGTNSLLMQNFGTKKIVTSFMQKIPGWRSLYKALLPFYPIAFEQFDFTGYDLVISHTSRFAKAIITKPEVRHVCFCMAPPRFLWNFSGIRSPKILLPYLSFLRIADVITSKRVDFWWVNSINTQQRVKKIYKCDSQVLYPFVDLDLFSNLDSFDGGYFLVVSRLIDYKRVDVIIGVFGYLGLPLKIVGTGPEFLNLQRQASGNIEFLGSVSDEVLLNLLAGCRGLIVSAEEDFGMSALEAQAAGKGVIAYGKGGSLETVVDGKTGIFFYEQSAESLNKALAKFSRIRFNPKDCQENASKFSKDIFKNSLLKYVEDLVD